MYTIKASEQYLKDYQVLLKKNKKFIAKIEWFLHEIKQHPRTGTGKIERLKYFKEREVYSRRIDREHRLVYEILEDDTIVILMTALGHYEDMS